MSTPASSAQQFRTFLKCPLDLAAAGLRRPAVLLENAVICHRAAPVQSTHAAGIGCSRIDEARVAIASGKGGVGKSTTTANVAVALAKDPQLKIGILDADVFGPSQPRLFGLKGRPEASEAQKMIPLRNHSVQVMSMGFLLEEDAPAVWRGPMVMSAIDTLLQKVEWGALDLLLVDMPPGTGDVQISISQRMSLAGAVIVSTPQDLALIDARKGMAMFQKAGVSVLGMVENMSHYACPSCGHRDDIFGSQGAVAAAADYGIQVLGEVPLNTVIRQTSDDGMPVVLSDPSTPSAEAYMNIAARLKDMLSIDSI
ncbi:hypothetical protein WJX84_007903 [Apatococcus fuscideae]|uniref:Iron-sulfur cluster carrier protein n=1 Tax=Apatococcus fuscideae TaxID=2026836 RepID=A0AAW1SXQ7_9CHLO